MRERAQVPAMTDENAVVHIAALSGRASLRLKSWMPEHTSDGRAVVLDGRDLPAQVGATVSGQIRVLCLGPGEWLIVSDGLSASSVREQIEQEVRRQGLALVDVTHGLVVLQIQGPAARDALSKGCGLDLHPRAFPAGQCARTHFAQIPLVVDCLDGPPRFELYVARSYLFYLQSWLVDAAAELGQAVPGKPMAAGMATRLIRSTNGMS